MPHFVTVKSCSAQNVTPVRLVVVLESPQNGHLRAIPRRDGHFIRWGMHKSKFRHFHHIGLTRLVSGILLRRVSKRRAPGMTAKGIKWVFEQEDQEVWA